MSNKKILKNRIKSVKSTQKITKAMQMIAAAKLRKAKALAESANPYAKKMGDMLEKLISNAANNPEASPLLIGRENNQTHLFIVATSDRGLCGAFNSSIIRAAKRAINDIRNQGLTVKIFFIGSKGYEQMRMLYPNDILGKVDGLGKYVKYEDAEKIAAKILSSFENKEFDVCTIIYNHFKSVLSQIVTLKQIIPLTQAQPALDEKNNPAQISSEYIYEPKEKEVLNSLLPKNIAVQIYHALLENGASEQGARMTAMDNATGNASEMIKSLTLKYNRSRQASITTELIEIISGAEAM